MSLQDLFTKVEEFLNAAESKTADYLDKGINYLKDLTAWLESQKEGLVQTYESVPVMAGFKAGPEDAKKCKELLARCEKLTAPKTGLDRETMKANGALFLLLLQLATTFLQNLLKNQPDA